MKNSFKRIALLGMLLISFVGLQNAFGAQSLEKLAKKLTKRIKQNSQIAILSFPDTTGKLNAGSSIIQERLTTFVVQRKKIEVIERNLIQKIMEEKKLGLTGVLDDSTTKELGKILGVQAIITGTQNDLKESEVEINARVIDIESGKILSAGQATIQKTWKDVKVGSDIEPPPSIKNFLGKPKVQLAILLDTSNSMDGLISQTKSQLWKIVNELVGAEKDGENPIIEVALFEYGNNNNSIQHNYVRGVLPFTINLDDISEQLFGLKTSGGSEHCGAVIQAAVNTLEWDPHDDVYKTIFIAGNEAFTQGTIDFRKSVKEAKDKGVIVNTIFCGNRQKGIATQWASGAEMGGGDYMNIDQDAAVSVINAPQDAEITKLNEQLNQTFIPYGTEGRKAKVKMYKLDRRAQTMGAGSSVERFAFKSSGQYSKSSEASDVVLQVQSGMLEAEKLDKEKLPEEMQKMDLKERKKYINEKIAEKNEIQKKISDLYSERKKYIAEKQKEVVKSGTHTLDQAMIEAVRHQAAKKKFKFK